MPIVIPDKLPATKVLRNENIFVMTNRRASRQDIRPLKILILNLMPTKITTETQLLRLLGNTPVQVQMDFLKTDTYISKNTSYEHLSEFYTTFDKVKQTKYDGMIITGAPVEKLDFEQVDYWDELCEIMKWSAGNVTSVLHICWGAQAGLYYHFGISKEDLPHKISGVYEHKVHHKNVKLMRGFDDKFFAPHSRYTKMSTEDIKNNHDLKILASSKEAGEYIVSTKSGNLIFVMGHCEYDSDTLANEYFRDVEKGINPSVPEHYFTDDDAAKPPIVKWRSHATLLFSNWLNYYLYQETPYNLDEIGTKIRK